MPGPPIALPDPLLSVTRRLEDAGHPSYLVGRCVRELLAGDEPVEFEIATEAAPEAILRLFPAAVVTAVDARRISLPTAVGPVDLIRISAPEGIETDLRQRDFRVHAVAYRPRDDRWIDPADGRVDLARGRLRTPRPAAESLAADPLRALRAARLVSELGLETDPELEAAMHEIAPVFEKLGGRRVRVEIDALLVGPHVKVALELLERTRIGVSLAPGAARNVAAIVSRLPCDLELRLAAWLCGAPVRATLRRLRCPRDRAVRIERMLQMHPIDAGTRAAREARARRLARRSEAERNALIALRTAELDAGPVDARARGRFEHLIGCLARAQRAEEQSRRRATLAIDGRTVMARLGCGPGARVGSALRFLAEQIERDPSQNQPDVLLALLDAWPRDS